MVPIGCNLKLSKDEGALLTNAFAYRRLISRLSYLTLSRPDIAFTVNKLSQFMSSPWVPHLEAAHHLLCYLKNAPSQGLIFLAHPIFISLHMLTLIGGVVLIHADPEVLVSWKSKK